MKVFFPKEPKKHIGNQGNVLKWKNGHVPYEISSNITLKVREVIDDAIADWNKDFDGCLKWLPHVKERDYVFFTTGVMCYSEIGRIKFKQEIVLNEMNCNGKGSVLHEMVHSIGFTHEHNRPDRDKYIDVLFLNIPYEWRKQYVKEIFDEPMDLGPYDYYSLMHYEVKSPDRDKPAFRILEEGVNASRIGPKKALTDTDKLKIRKFYCPL